MSILVGLAVMQIVDIDFDKKSLNLNVEFLLKWSDQYIKINSSVQSHQNTVRVKNISDIWSPDLYIYGMKRFDKQKDTSIVLRNNNDGFVDVTYTFEVAIQYARMI